MTYTTTTRPAARPARSAAAARPNRRGRAIWRGLLLLLAAVLALAACGADDDDSMDASDDATFAPAVVDGGADTAAGGTEAEEADFDAEAGTGDPSVAQAAQVAAGDRLLRREATLRVEVTELAPAVDAATARVEAAGGYLASEWSSPTRSSLTLRIPGGSFDGLLDELAALGELQEQVVSTQDRTEIIVDLRARLETAEASLARTRTFFDEATTVEELTLLEREVAERESLVASLQAQLDGEVDSVTLSTVNIDFELDPTVAPEDVAAPEPGPGIVDALASGWSALRTVLHTSALALSWLLPFLPIVVVALFVGRWVLMWRRSRVVARTSARPSGSPDERSGTPPPPVATGASPGSASGTEATESDG